MYERYQVLARILAAVTAERKKRRARTLKTDRTLQQLVADLVAARRAAAMTQEEVAARMWTTKSVAPPATGDAGPVRARGRRCALRTP